MHYKRSRDALMLTFLVASIKLGPLGLTSTDFCQPWHLVVSREGQATMARQPGKVDIDNWLHIDDFESSAYDSENPW